ncbi:MAG: BMP family ABC transporter substrate-binding protein [Armatimonadetes bacterium]|jgi:basic membrane protein A|nr:BMP family ABC transporter substrate-binding protein [Armatimonadota bacterium]
MNRRHFLALSLSGALIATGGSCGKKQETPAPPSGEGKKIKAGLVTDTGGVGDKSFNAQAWAGLQKAEKELGAQVKYVESKQNADYVANLTKFAEAKYDVVFAVGFLMQDALKEVAFKFPKVKFAIIDGDAPSSSNCVAYKFREEEGSFLAGALAASVSKSGVLGFVGGMEMPLIKKFEYGYQAGAFTIKPDIQTRVAYVGDFNDSQKGMELALSQMGMRADIVYHAAGKAGIGVIKAAQTKGEGYYAIGVDKDQDDEAPGRVLTSMVKRVDVAVFDVCKQVKEGHFNSGTVELGLKEDGIGLSVMKNTKDKIPADVLKKIEELKQEIIEGKLKPPADARGFDNFTKAKVGN